METRLSSALSLAHELNKGNHDCEEEGFNPKTHTCDLCDNEMVISQGVAGLIFLRKQVIELTTQLLNDDYGINGVAYNTLKTLVEELGESFPHHVDATDGRFYLPSDNK